jgi:hypothetical protein
MFGRYVINSQLRRLFMKSILGAILAITLFSWNAFAISPQLSCQSYSTDGNYTKLDYFTIFYDINNLFSYSYFKDGRMHQYSFRYSGPVDKKSANVSIAQVGKYVHWTEDTFGQNPWVDVTSPVQGYVRAQKGKHKVLKKGIIGEGLIPFLNNNQRVVVKCVDVTDDGGGCWFGCN